MLLLTTTPKHAGKVTELYQMPIQRPNGPYPHSLESVHMQSHRHFQTVLLCVDIMSHTHHFQAPKSRMQQILSESGRYNQESPEGPMQVEFPGGRDPYGSCMVQALHPHFIEVSCLPPHRGPQRTLFNSVHCTSSNAGNSVTGLSQAALECSSLQHRKAKHRAHRFGNSYIMSLSLL